MHELRSDHRLQLSQGEYRETPSPAIQERRKFVVIVTSEDSPTKRTQDIRDTPVRGVLDAHNWYPAVQRCACGLSLRTSAHWVSHICQLAASNPAATA